jgi:hypothetical protein
VAQWSRHWAGRRLIASSNPTPARYRRRPCGVAWMSFRTLMVEYINKWDFYLIQSIQNLCTLIPTLPLDHFTASDSDDPNDDVYDLQTMCLIR